MNEKKMELLRSFDLNTLNTRKKLGSFIKMFIILCILGFWAYELNSIYLAFESVTWQKVKAVITKSSYYSNGTGNKKSVHADMSYKYNINGKEYTGTRLFFRPTDFTEAHSIKELVELNPVDSSPEIYVCERDPEKSVIYAGVSQFYTVVSLGISSVFSAFFLVPIYFLNRERDEINIVLREKGQHN